MSKFNMTSRIFALSLLIILGSLLQSQALLYSQETPTPAAETPAPAPTPAAETPAPAPAPAAETPAPAPAPEAETPAPAPAPAAETPAPAPAPEAETPAPAPTPAAETPAPAPAPAAETPAPAPAPAPETPVAETPAEPVPPAPVRAYDPTKGYSSLSHPSVAARLGLSDEQIAEVGRLQALLAQQLKATPQEQWTDLREETDKKLFAVLTSAQQALWPSVFKEKTIRIMFRMQSWSDVLQWFADQAGLQLVMDAPPPGTLNYSDPREYTPTEAIDLLNSILQTKGFTLVRNGKMLMLFDLKRGRIPVQFLPKLKPEQLAERGRFEYTTVIFPLDQRNRADVIQTIEPFKGSYCQIVPMPGNSLMVTDTASTLLVLQKVIESVHNPPRPERPTPQEPPPPPPPPVWKTYLVEHNDPAKIEEIFKEFSPTGKSLRVGNSREIHFLVTEGEHVKLDAILKMLEEDSGIPKGDMILQSYSITPLLDAGPQLWRQGRMTRPVVPGQIVNPYDTALNVGKEIIDMLKKTYPAAIVSETPVASNVVVLASAADQAKIKEFFDTLRKTLPPEDEPVAKLYRYADPAKKMDAETLKQLQGIVPAGIYSLDEERGHVLVVATAKEQEMLAGAVKEMETAATPTEDKLIVSYRMPAATATRFSAMLRQLVTKKELADVVEVRDTKQGLVSVWATARQHEAIQRLLDEILGRKTGPAPEGTSAPSEPVIGVYPMEKGNAYTAHTVLSSMIVGAEFAYDYRTNAVIAMATPDVQEVVKKGVEELDKGVNDDVAFLKLRQEVPPDVLRQMNRVAPRSVVIQNRRNLQIIATGPQSELDKIKAILSAGEAAPETKEEIYVHTFQTAVPTTVAALLKTVFPEVEATPGASGNQLILRLSSDLKEPVLALFGQIDGELEIVAVKRSPSPATLQTLRALAPQTTITADAENGQVLIQGSKADVEKVKKALAQSEASAAEEEIYVHTFTQAYPYYVVAILREVYPEIRVAGYPTSNQLAVRVRPDQKEKVVALFKQVDGELLVVPLKKELSPELLGSFARLAPATVVLPDPTNFQVVLSGPKPEVEKIRKLIEASEAAAPADEEVYIHTFRLAVPTQAAAVLKEIYPRVRVAGNPAENQLALRIPADQKETVVALLAEMDGDIVFVPLRQELSPEVLASLPQIAPKATVVLDRRNSLAMVYGSKPDIERVKMILTQSETGGEEDEIYVHTFRQVHPYYVMAVLQQVYPEVKLAAYPSHNQLAVRFRPEMKEKVLTLFEQSDGDIVFIPLKKELPASVLASFPQVAPYAVTVLDKENSQVMVYGPKPDVEKIQKIIQASEAAAPIEEDVYVHTFKSADPAYAATVIREIYPEVRVAASPTAKQLTLRVRPELKAKVLALLEEMDGDIVFVPLTQDLSDEMIAAFPRIAPAAVVIPDRRNSLAMIYGPKPDVERVRSLITTTQAAGPGGEEIIVHTLKHVESSSVVEILKEIHPDAKITDDAENGRLVIRLRPGRKEAFMTLLAQLDAADPDKEKRYFKSYPLDTGLYSIQAGWNPYTPVQFVTDLQKIVPRAKLSFDMTSQQLIAWGTAEEHAAIEAAVKNMSEDGDAKKYGRFQLRRLQPHVVIPILRRMYPTVTPTYDQFGQSVIVEGHPRLVQKIAEMIETLDPAEPSPMDPTVRFYALQSEPSDVLVDGLQKLVPTAQIVADKDARQIMVIAKPDEQKIIESNMKLIVATYSAPEEPMLFIYRATPRQREQLEAFVRTAAKDLKGVTIVPDTAQAYRRLRTALNTEPVDNQILVWAKPSEHQLIDAVLRQMEENLASEPLRQLKVFHLSIGDLVTAEQILRVSHPDATPFVDRQGNRLLVWATPEDLENVTQTLTIQGNLDNRQMLAYPVAGSDPQTVMKVIQDVFQGLKITPETQTRRLLVWATPEEHVKIAEIVEQSNKELDPASELAEKFVAYSAASLDIRMITPLFKALIPNTDVYAETTADKIVVRARQREHAKIAELLEQLREKDEKLRPILAVYPIKETDPVMIEAMLRNQLPNAESMTEDEVVERLGYQYYMERMPWYSSYYNRGQAPQKKVGYYKVDPQTQAAYVFAIGEDQIEVAKAVEQIVAVADQEIIKPTVRRYSLDEMSVWDIYRLLQQVAPSARIESIYTHSPQNEDGGYMSYRLSYRDFLAYARESEHEKIEKLVREMNDSAGSGLKEMLSVTLPDASRYSREKIIETVRKLYPDIVSMPGGSPNQILIWSSKHKLEKVQQIIDEACRPLPEGQQTVVKAYPLRYVSAEEAKTWLTALCPNASFDPTAQTPAPVRPPVRPGAAETKQLFVIATPLEHLEIAKALEELDRDQPESHKMTPRLYSLDDYPVTTFYPLYRSLVQAFPNASCSQGAEQQSVLVVATEDDHKKVAEFLKAYKDDREEKRPSLEVYALKKLNYYKVAPLIQRIAPPPKAQIMPASKPEQIAVWASLREHHDIAAALMRLETAANDVENQSLRVYKVGTAQEAQLTSQIMNYQFPGSLTFALPGRNEVLSWACEADHESMTAMFKIVAEAFPEPFLKSYFFEHIPLGEGATVLSRVFAAQAIITPRASGDVLVHATQDIHDKIAKSIAECDRPRPASSDALPVAYDLSELPLQQLNYAAVSIRQALSNQVVILPSGVPGQLVVWGRLSDQEKVKSMIDQMITERPDHTARMRPYTITRGTAALARQNLLDIVPNARYGYGLNPNQLLVWAKEADHAKVADVVKTLNEADPALEIEAYSLKDSSYGAASTVRTFVQTRGINARITQDYGGNRLLIEATAEDQKLIAELFEKLKVDERTLEVFTLETADPMTVYYAINTLFYDEMYSAPEATPDMNTNMIFVKGTREQLDKTRAMLIEMGETQLRRRAAPTDGTGIPTPGNEQYVATGAAGGGRIRSITIQGDADATIRELEKLWPQYQRNQLRVIRQDAPLIQRREEPQAPPQSEDDGKTSWRRPAGERSVGFFSVSDPVERPAEPATAPETTEAAEAAGESSLSESLRRIRETLPADAPVYIVVNEDGSLTVTSYDTEALDQLERLVKRIDERVVFEGRDYTIYSVRNISADLVAAKIRLVLRERLAGQRPQIGGTSSRYQAPTLQIQEDVTNNTIFVKGAKAERREVANLIALFDVSELPGERSITKPLKVPIKNTQASRVLQQVFNVYQQKIWSIRLPGGVMPRITVDNITNSLEIIAPEPLASELKDYALEIDRMVVEDPPRKIHVIPLEVKSSVIQSAIQRIQMSSGGGYNPYGYQYPAR